MTKINQLPKADREELLRRLKDSAPKKLVTPSLNGAKQPLEPNTIWIKENSHLYRGQYVAIKDGKFIASGRTIKEAHLAAKANGVDKPLLHYVLAEGEEAFYSGW